MYAVSDIATDRSIFIGLARTVAMTRLEISQE